MGVIRHNAIVITTTDGDGRLEKLTKFLDWLEADWIGPSKPVTNWYQSILVCPDGSKEGWDESDRGDYRRELLRKWLTAQEYGDGSNSFAWAEVQYGDSDFKVEVIHSFRKDGSHDA